MNNLPVRRAAVLLAAAALAFTAQPALAAFGEASAQVWVARSQKIAEAVGRPVTMTGDMAENERVGKAYFDEVKAACSGITGEHIRYGGKNMPVWAQTAQQKFCVGADQMAAAYKNAEKDKGYCRDLKAVAGYASKAKRGEDPDAVVDAAKTLTDAAQKLMDSKIVLERWSVLGTRQIIFSC